jgi:hypothetical protein
VEEVPSTPNLTKEELVALTQRSVLTRRVVNELLSATEHDSIKDLALNVLSGESLLNKTFGFIPKRPVQIADSIGQWWPARMIKYESGRILCSYDNFGPDFDEWIDIESRRLRVQESSNGKNNLKSPAIPIELSSDPVIEVLSSKAFRRRSFDPSGRPRKRKPYIPSKEVLERRRKKLSRDLKENCQIGSHVEVFGPEGWQAARVEKMTPFRILVRYKHGENSEV